MKGRKEEGITLIALVITIIVLLILAGVTISLTFGENGILARAKEGKDKYAEAEQNEIDILDNLDYQFGTLVENGTIDPDNNVTNKPNAPKLDESKAMIPVYYDNTEKVWKKAPEDNEGNMWYDYSNKKWANIVTVSDENANLRIAEVGTEIPMEDITTFFVWIPRYAYSIREGTKTSNEETPSQTNSKAKKISITFLKGTSNIGTDGVNYGARTDSETGIEVTKNTDGTYNYDLSKVSAGEPTPKIVHPAFTFGEKQLTGIWVAKFEASGLTNGDTGEAVGNYKEGTTLITADETKTYVRVLPNEISWRHISIGESQYQSMNMKNNTLNTYGWSTAVDSHLMRNSEWGAAAYLCYSAFGNVPERNAAGTSKNSRFYDFHTGAGPNGTDSKPRYDTWSENANGYDTANGQLASTTGNVYGIYDMSGGSWDWIAAYYDNGHTNLNINGKSKENSYFDENNKVLTTYEKYWNAYKAEENGNNYDSLSDEERYNVTKEIWDNLEKAKGIGINEMAGSWSYRGLIDGSGKWKVNTTDTDQTFGLSWNNDSINIGGGSNTFLNRGGSCSDGTNTGLFALSAMPGSSWDFNTFRPVLAF